MSPTHTVLCVLPLLAPCTSPDDPPLETEGTRRPPNIVLILADDLGFGDPRCYNPKSKIPTPNIDRLAKEGMLLTDAHTPSSVCTPTRYGLLTGRYAWRTELTRGVLWGDSANLIEPERVTLPEVLRERGYHTFCCGKWHLGFGTEDGNDWSEPVSPSPLDHGFDRFFGIAGALDMPPYAYVEGDRLTEPATELFEESGLRRFGGEGFWRPGPGAKGFRHEEVLPDITAQAVAYVEQRHAEEPERPFFLFFSLTAPHTPWVPTKAFQGESEAGWYGDFVNQIDSCVGEVLAVLDRLELADDTLVLFTSDNGAHWTADDIREFDHLANGDWRGQKGDIHEGGHRVPLLVRWPGRVPAGSVRDELLCLTDLYPTLATLAGADVPEGAAPDAVDQAPLLLGEELDAPPRNDVVHHSFEGMLAIRRDSWKLVAGLGSGGFTAPYYEVPGPGDPPGQLYDLAKDPGETKNLWDDEPERVRDLLELLAGRLESE